MSTQLTQTKEEINTVETRLQQAGLPKVLEKFERYVRDSKQQEVDIIASAMLHVHRPYYNWFTFFGYAVNVPEMGQNARNSGFESDEALISYKTHANGDPEGKNVPILQTLYKLQQMGMGIRLMNAIEMLPFDATVVHLALEKLRLAEGIMWHGKRIRKHTIVESLQRHSNRSDLAFEPPVVNVTFSDPTWEFLQTRGTSIARRAAGLTLRELGAVKYDGGQSTITITPVNEHAIFEKGIRTLHSNSPKFIWIKEDTFNRVEGGESKDVAAIDMIHELWEKREWLVQKRIIPELNPAIEKFRKKPAYAKEKDERFLRVRRQ